MANKLGLNLFLWTEELKRSTYPLLKKVKKAGYDTVEIPLLDPDRLKVNQVKELLADHELDVSICTVLPPKAHLGSDSERARRAGVRFIRKCIDVAAEIGCDMIAGPLYSPVGFISGKPRRLGEWKRAVRCYKEIAKMAEDKGVSIAIEPLNRFETYFLNTAADAKKFVQEVDHPSIGILFDTFHANLEEKDVAQAILSCNFLITHVHISENDRGIPGTGHVDWEGVQDALDRVSYGGRLVIETFGYALPGISRAASIWRPLFPDADTFVAEGISFLRELAGVGEESQPEQVEPAEAEEIAEEAEPSEGIPETS